MKNPQVQNLYSNANQMLHTADAEMNRAEEDAVTHLICHNSRQSIIGYLKGFLLSKDVELVEPVTLSGLLEQCAAMDSRFKKIDASPIQCRFETHDKDYCLDMEAVVDCYQIAKQTKILVEQ